MSSHCLRLSPPEETLLQCTDLASCVRLLKPEHLNTGLELIRRIQERLVAILQHSTQVGTCAHTHYEEQNTKCGANTYWMHCGPINSKSLGFPPVWSLQTQDFRVGYNSKTGQEQESAQASNLSKTTDANKA